MWKWNEFNADYERFYYESVTLYVIVGLGSWEKVRSR